MLASSRLLALLVSRLLLLVSRLLLVLLVSSLLLLLLRLVVVLLDKPQFHPSTTGSLHLMWLLLCLAAWV